MAKIIAISGWKQSGKDTIADYLVKNYNFIKFKFADTLKDMVAEQYSISRDWCDDNEYKEKPIKEYPVASKDKFTEMIINFMQKEFKVEDAEQFWIESAPDKYENGKFLKYCGHPGEYCETTAYWTPRTLCILEGSVKRSVNANYWVDRVVDSIFKADGEKNIENKEVSAVISDLRYRSEVERLKQAFSTDLITIRINRFNTCVSADPSERDLDEYNFDIVLENKETLEELFEKLETIVKEI